MLPIQELLEGSVDDVVGWLAKRAAEVRTGNRTYREKAAAEASGVLGSLGDAVSSNPVLSKALLGGGIGAAAGAGHHLFAGDEDAPGGKRRGILGKALTGGMAGAALGGGVGAVQSSMSGGGGKGSGPGSGVFGVGGKNYKIDPAALKENPQLLEQVQNAASAGPLHESLPGAALRFITNNPLAPTTTPYMLPAAAADTALHSQTLRLGDRNWAKPVGASLGWMGGLFNRGGGSPNALQRAGQSVTDWGEKAKNKGWFPGQIDAKNSRNPEHMRLGIEAATKAKDAPAFASGVQDTLKQIAKNDDMQTGLGPVTTKQKGQDVLKGLADDPTATVTAHGEKTVPGKKGVVYRSGYDEHGRAKYNRALKDVSTKEPFSQHLDSPIRGQLAELGANTEAAANAGNPALKNYNPSNKASVNRGGFLGGGDRVLESGPFSGSRGMKRLGFYLGVPAAEWAARSYAHDIGKSQDLRKLLADAAAKGHIRPMGDK